MRRLVALAGATSLALGTAPAGAAPPPGATSCTGCHAASKLVATPVPRIAGMEAAKLVEALKAFRAGRRPATVMDRIAKGFTDAEIEALGAWFEGQK